jgi:hypothetical protein
LYRTWASPFGCKGGMFGFIKLSADVFVSAYLFVDEIIEEIS